MNERDHIGDDAALYALGALDEHERRVVERHADACAPCSRSLSRAESDVANMAAAEPAYALPPALRRSPRPNASPARFAFQLPWTALAAAFAIALVPSAYYWQQSRAMHDAMAARSQALSRLAAGDLRTATFAGMPDGATARVMYPSDGSWYVVLVRGANSALDLAWMHDGRRTMLGSVRPQGDVAMLYLPKSHRMDRLALVEGERVVAEAQLAYESK